MNNGIIHYYNKGNDNHCTAIGTSHIPYLLEINYQSYEQRLYILVIHPILFFNKSYH
jgi:hypothetical protein